MLIEKLGETPLITFKKTTDLLNDYLGYKGIFCNKVALDM